MIAVLVALCCELARSADWLVVHGDQEHSNFQPDEKQLNVQSVRRMQLLWEYRSSGKVLSDPVMLGPIITDHGIKELVFVRDGEKVYAVDADLGTVFWSRSITQSGDPAGQTTQQGCEETGKISPLLNWSSAEPKPVKSGDDEFSDGNRPLYVLDTQGQVHVLRPRTGADLIPPLAFVPAHQIPASLGEQEGVLYATGARACGTVPNQTWSRPVGVSGLALGPISNSARPPEAIGLTSFEWSGRNWDVNVKADGEPVLQTARDGARMGGTATVAVTFQGLLGQRWIYTVAGNFLRAFRVKAGADGPVAAEAWRVSTVRAGTPAAANGVVYVVSEKGGPGKQALRAFDAFSGTELFASRDEINSQLPAGNLAIANGHVCFSFSPARLRCYGMPFTM